VEAGGGVAGGEAHQGQSDMGCSPSPPCERVVCVGEYLELSARLPGTSVRWVLCGM
jgi:hypothetical protein